MSIPGEEAGREVRFGATVAAVGHAVGVSGPAVLVAWAAHVALASIRPVLNAVHIALPHLPWGPPAWALSLPVATAVAAVSGLLIRWLLVGRPSALRPDARLAGYVALIVASVVITSFVSFAILPTVRGRSTLELSLRSAEVGLVITGFTLGYALLALWPVSVLIGDRLSPGAAIARMRQAYLTYLGVSFLVLLLPALVSFGLIVVRRSPRDLTDILLSEVASTLATTVGSVVLAQIYSRRVRGHDLGAAPQESVADVFA